MSVREAHSKSLLVLLLMPPQLPEPYQIPLPPPTSSPQSSLGRGLSRVQLPLKLTIAPPPLQRPNTPTHPPTLHKPTATPIVGPLWLPLTGEKAQLTPSFFHIPVVAAPPVGTARPRAFCLADTPLKLPHRTLRPVAADSNGSFTLQFLLLINECSKNTTDFLVPYMPA